MIKYEINHELMNRLKYVLKTLHQSKQNLFTCAEVCVFLNGLNACKPIAPKPNNKVIEGKVEPKNAIPLPTKPKKNDGK